MRREALLMSCLLSLLMVGCSTRIGESKDSVTVRLEIGGVEKARLGSTQLVVEPYVARTPWPLYRLVGEKLEALGVWSPTEIWAHETTVLFSMHGGTLPDGLEVLIRAEQPYLRARATVGDLEVEYSIAGNVLVATARGQRLWRLTVDGTVARDLLQDYFAAAIANTARGSKITDLVDSTVWNYGAGGLSCADDGMCPRNWCKELIKRTWKWLVGGGAAVVGGAVIAKGTAVLNNLEECNAEVQKCVNNQQGCMCNKADCDSLCNDKGMQCASDWSKQKPTCEFTPPGGGPPTGKVYFMCNYACEKKVACSELCSPESIVYSSCGCPSDHLNASCSGNDYYGRPIADTCLGSSEVTDYSCEQNPGTCTNSLKPGVVCDQTTAP